MVIAEKQKELIEYYDQEVRSTDDKDIPFDEEGIEKTAYEDITSAITEFWDDDADLDSYLEQPWLFRLLGGTVQPLKELFFEKGLMVDVIDILPMGTIRITVTV